MRRNTDNVTRLDGKLFSLRADAQNSIAFKNIKNLLSIVVLMQRRRLSRLNDDHKDLGCFGIRPVHDQVVDMRWELVALDLRCWKNKLHQIIDLLGMWNRRTGAGNFSPTKRVCA